MLDLVLELAEPVADYFLIYKRNKADFLEGMKLEGISTLLFIVAAVCGFVWRLWLLAAAFLGGALWFGGEWHTHFEECIRKERKY